MRFHPRATPGAVADVLTKTADVLEHNPSLGADGAIRAAIWGTGKVSPIPDGTTGGLLYDEACSAIEGHWANARGYECGDLLDDIPAREAIESARSEAARFRSYR